MHTWKCFHLLVIVIMATMLMESEARRFRQFKAKREEDQLEARKMMDEDESVCTCGVFMSGQFNRSTKARPRGNAVLSFETDDTLKPCGGGGYKQCINKCLDVIIKHVPKSGKVICDALDRDCYKEKAYLYIKNCSPKWIPTNFSAGKEYCCKDGDSYKCNKEKAIDSDEDYEAEV